MSILGCNLNQVNQILPHKNKWAWDLYLRGCNNHWMPTEISMQKDIEQWKSNILTPDERLLIKRVLGFFACSESLIGNNLVLTVFRYVNDGEMRQYLTRQITEEALHNLTVVYCCDSLNLNVDEIYEAYLNVPTVKKKDDFLIKETGSIYQPHFNIDTYVDRYAFVKNLYIYYVLFEGLLFYNSFAALLSLKRRNLMPGLGQQIEYTLRDECVDGLSEVLTPNGWKNVQALSYHDKIAQYNENGTIEFVHPIKLSKSYVDNAYTFQSYQGHIDLVVSENHRMVKLNTKTNKLKIDFAKDIKLHPYSKFIMAGQKLGGIKHFLSWEEKYLIALQADGSIPKGKYRNGNHCGYRQINFFFKKKRKIDRFQEILNNIKLPYTKKPERDGIKYTVNTPLHLCKKTFIEWVCLSDVSIEWCVDFCHEISLWDGHNVKNSNNNRITYGSVIKSNVDIVQAIACLSNYRTHVTVKPDKRSKNFSDYWKIQICKQRNSVKCSIVEKNKIYNYNDYVYGIQVPSSLLLIRRNNSVCITGNSTHVEFGINLINQINDENEIFYRDQALPLLNEVIELENGFIEEMIPNGLLGFNKESCLQYIKYLANRRFSDLYFSEPFPEVQNNPFSWLSENIDLPKMKNFFESRVIDYKVGGLIDDF